MDGHEIVFHLIYNFIASSINTFDRITRNSRKSLFFTDAQQFENENSIRCTYRSYITYSK